MCQEMAFGLKMVCLYMCRKKSLRSWSTPVLTVTEIFRPSLFIA